MNPQVLRQYTLSPRSPCVSLVGPSGSKYADRDTILPAVCVCLCVLVSDVIYVTTAVRAADKLISCLRLPSPRPLLLDSWLVALVAAGPRNCILTRFLVCRM